MPYKRHHAPRLAAGELACHALSRRVGRLFLFETPAETILAEAYERFRMQLTAYCLMPNHWHPLLWPRRDGELSELLRWITVTHTQRRYAFHYTAGTGPVYPEKRLPTPFHRPANCPLPLACPQKFTHNWSIPQSWSELVPKFSRIYTPEKKCP